MQKISNNTDSITTTCRHKAVKDVTCFILCYPDFFYWVKIGLELEIENSLFYFLCPLKGISLPQVQPLNIKANSYLCNILKETRQPYWFDREEINLSYMLIRAEIQ